MNNGSREEKREMQGKKERGRKIGRSDQIKQDLKNLL
jgi:hypothetical protein